MVSLEILRQYIDNLLIFDPDLDTVKIDPFMTNGLLVKGQDKIVKVGFGVSASIRLFELAKKENCQAVVVHHSFNLPSNNNYDPLYQDRISFLIKNGMSLFGYHFLLDAHPEIGNNVRILNAVGAEKEKPYYFHGQPWGYTGTFGVPHKLADIKKLLSDLLSPQAIYYDFGGNLVSRVVAVSGKGAPSSSDMIGLIRENIGLYITGEAHEWNRELFREAGINFIAGGHYHTEMFGLKALMEKVAKDYPQLSCIWLDLPNDV